MTTKKSPGETEICPARELLKMLTGKWKAEIFRLSIESPLRFSTLLRKIKGASKQSLSLALKELEADGLLQKIIIKHKPLHIEHSLTEKGELFIPIFEQLEKLGSQNP